LRGAYLRGAYLGEADLSRADLSGANLSRADLSRANLSGADLRGADLRGADLRGADLSVADLRRADLSRADLREAVGLESIQHEYQIVPEDGSFIAWKKCQHDKNIKLEIPADAKRACNFINRKCRAEYVKVIGIYDMDKQLTEDKTAIGIYDSETIYTIGEITYSDSFNPDMRTDCTNGIHFFVTFEEAKNWNP
jgi:hypothetical protein